MKILVIQKKKIGDVLTSTVIFDALRQKFPEAKLHYLIYPNSLAVVEGNPNIDKLVFLDEKTRKSKRKFIQFLFSIRKEKYDVVIDAYGKPNSVLIGWFSGAKTKITYDKIYSRILYSHAVKRNEISFSEGTRAIEHRIILLEPLGIEYQDFAPKIYLNSDEIEEAKATLLSNSISLEVPIIMCSIIGSTETKTYPFAYMAEVLDLIAKDRNVQILLNYMPFQRNLVDEILSLCKKETVSKIRSDFFENDLRKFIAITSFCKALIGNEGGATNMSKAIGIPTFSIYNPFVKKQDWDMFAKNSSHISVHLDDYLEQQNEEEINLLYETNNNQELYNKFKVNLFEKQLVDFLKINCN